MTVSVADRGDTVDLTVADGGPGIDDAAIETLRSGRGTRLRHTSRFGLWPVGWTASLSAD